MKLSTFIFVAFVLISALHVNVQDKWQFADEATLRLEPAAFSQLPKNIVLSLSKAKVHCAANFRQFYAAQCYPGSICPQRKIRLGNFMFAQTSFINPGFLNGSTKSVAEVARFGDKDYLQTIDGTANIGFSRAIDVVGKSHIFAHYREYGGRKPPPIKHQGINDAFVEKASSVHYFYRKRWLKLQGVD